MMGVKEDFLAWTGYVATIEKWNEYKKMKGVDFNDEYFYNVVCVEEKGEEVVKDLPPDPGFIGGGGIMEDMST